MSYSLEVRPAAVIDIESAAGWYETQEAGLGSDFVLTVIKAIESLPLNPLIYRLRDRRHNVRWLTLDRFPYKVVFQLQNDLVIVFAVLHVARRDRHWKQRV